MSGISRIVQILRSFIFPVRSEQFAVSGVGPIFCFPVFNLHDILEQSLYLATPKKRRTIEQRRIRKFLTLRFGEYKPRDDLVSCKICGFLNPRGFICVNCYDKVREETSYLRSLIKGKLPSDRPIRFVYENDTGQEQETYSSVRVDRDRPSWFPLFRIKNRPNSDNDNS